MTRPPLPRVCVVYLLRRDADASRVLLGRKKKGLGEGKLVAPGGKLEPGESPVDAAVREVEEEVGLRVDAADLREAGVIDYLFPSKPEWSQQSHVFVTERWSGELRGSDELDARWFTVARVPLARMWADARHWLPEVLDGASVAAGFTFASDRETVATARVRFTEQRPR